MWFTWPLQTPNLSTLNKKFKIELRRLDYELCILSSILKIMKAYQKLIINLGYALIPTPYLTFILTNIINKQFEYECCYFQE